MSTRADERGVTVIELSVVMAILSLVVATLVGVLEVHTRAERRTMASINSQEAVSLALVALARDVRAANPLLVLDSVGDYASELEVRLGEPVGGYSNVRWKLDTSTGILSRHTIPGPNQAPTATTYRLARVHNAEQNLSLFRYFNSEGTELTPVNATAADYANCTIRVQIAIVADPDPGARPFTSESAVQLRNRLPGGIGC